jgi:hypothetical protein
MRQRSLVSIVLLAVVAGFAGFLVRAVDAGDASARASATELAAAHRVSQLESALTATARAVPTANRAPMPFTDAKSAAFRVATLWVVAGTLLLLPLARSLTRPARRRRAPPFLVA